jgi:uncharacterized protein YndB with AHSA1/START domain
VTVEYERARGMRAKHERPSGFEVSVSKTVAASAERVFEAVTSPEARARWLPGVRLTERTARPAKTARFDWDDGRTRIVVHLDSKGSDKTTVTVAHERLANSAEAERTKTEWRERLARLKEVIER